MCWLCVCSLSGLEQGVGVWVECVVRRIIWRIVRVCYCWWTIFASCDANPMPTTKARAHGARDGALCCCRRFVRRQHDDGHYHPLFSTWHTWRGELSLLSRTSARRNRESADCRNSTFEGIRITGVYIIPYSYKCFKVRFGLYMNGMCICFVNT